MDDGSPVDVIYLDFQKAFDKVPNQRLILKLKATKLISGLRGLRYEEPLWTDNTRNTISKGGGGDQIEVFKIFILICWNTRYQCSEMRLFPTTVWKSQTNPSNVNHISTHCGYNLLFVLNKRWKQYSQLDRAMEVSEQCRIAASKGNQVLGMIRRNITYKKSLIVPLYKAIVRPHLEYCIQAWSPYIRKDIYLLEKIQRRATKLISGLRS